MRIAWFTPFSDDSAIGRYSQSITNELVRDCEVDIWTSKSDKSLLETNLKIFYYQSNDNLSERLKGYDFIVYNIGNNLTFHKDIYEAQLKAPGIVILHDFVMQHFFAAYFHHKGEKNSYVETMERFYGAAGRQVALDSVNTKITPVWETDEVVKYPLFEKAIEGAYAVITHSQFHAEQVRQRFIGPVGIIYHPFYSYSDTLVKSNISKFDLGIPQDRVLIVSVGHVNPNKRMDKVINVLGRHKDIAEKALYLIIGPYIHKQYYSRLQSLIKSYNLQNIVKFLGYQPDDVLYAYLKNADILINLRYPNTEGASWSLIEQMHFSRAIVVNNTGFYAEIPSDCVVKIDVGEREEGDLANALKSLSSSESLRRELGMRAKQFASENFTPQKYCRKFTGFLKKIKGWMPVINLTDKITVELFMMGVMDDSPIVDAVSKEIYEMLPIKD